MNDRIVQLSFFLLIFLMGCSSTSTSDPLLEEAFQIHEQSMEVAKEAREMLEELPADDQYRLNIESRLEFWSENLVEVPGFEHEHDHDHDHGHDHDHDHDHDHGPKLELTPEDMLAVQKEFLDSIQVIKSAIIGYEK